MSEYLPLRRCRRRPQICFASLLCRLLCCRAVPPQDGPARHAANCASSRCLHPEPFKCHRNLQCFLMSFQLPRRPFRPRTRRLGLHSPDILAGRVRQQPAGQVGWAGWVAAAAGRLLLTSCFLCSGSGSHLQPAGHSMQQEQSAPPPRCLHALLTPLPGRPGNLYQDSVSAYCVLDPSFWTSYHTFGLVSVCWWVGGFFCVGGSGTGQWLLLWMAAAATAAAGPAALCTC
jgi:hypothetical protein